MGILINGTLLKWDCINLINVGILINGTLLKWDCINLINVSFFW